jgi:hypothetical protein
MSANQGGGVSRKPTMREELDEFHRRLAELRRALTLAFEPSVAWLSRRLSRRDTP